MKRMLVVGMFIFLSWVGTAHAQQDATRWGVIGSFVPTWEVPKRLAIVFGTEDASASAVDVRGSEFRIGVARGRELGGDWSVSFVRKRFKNDAVVTASETDCFFNGSGSCVEIPYGSTHTLGSAVVSGVEYQSFRPFATIKERVQIGLTWGGGVGKVEGTAKGQRFGPEGTFNDDRPAKEIFPNVAGYALPIVPLARLELSVAGLVAPGLKVRASGGFNFPGYEVASVSVVYFFGRR